jgi:hypothetical protein
MPRRRREIFTPHDWVERSSDIYGMQELILLLQQEWQVTRIFRQQSSCVFFPRDDNRDLSSRRSANDTKCNSFYSFPLKSKGT